MRFDRVSRVSSGRGRDLNFFLVVRMKFHNIPFPFFLCRNRADFFLKLQKIIAQRVLVIKYRRENFRAAGDSFLVSACILRSSGLDKRKRKEAKEIFESEALSIDIVRGTMVNYFLRRYGGVSERFMELVLKTSDIERYQEFESLPLRQKKLKIMFLNRFTMEKYPSGEGAPLLRE